VRTASPTAKAGVVVAGRSNRWGVRAALATSVGGIGLPRPLTGVAALPPASSSTVAMPELISIAA
jgi:hypothetical protein